MPWSAPAELARPTDFYSFCFLAAPQRPDEVMAVDDALERLQQRDPAAAQLVKLRYFSGLTIPQAAEVLGVSPRTADRLWVYARSWLFREISRNSVDAEPDAT